MQVCSEERDLEWGQTSFTNAEEVTLKVIFGLTAEVALPPPQVLYLSLSLSLSLQERIETFPRDNQRASVKPPVVPACAHLLPTQSAASPVTLSIDCNARTTGRAAVARINFIDVNKLR